MEKSPATEPAVKRSSWRIATAFIAPPSYLVIAQIVAVVVIALFTGKYDGSGVLFGDQRLTNVVLSGLVYLICLGLLLLFLRKYLFAAGTKIAEMLGLAGKLKLIDVGRTLLIFLAYFAVSISVAALATKLIPGFDIEQAQEIGQSQPRAISEYLIAFVGLVVLPPIFEELIFRGFMFGSLRRQLAFWPSAVLTSIAFGVIHGQWNVGVDTFVLSMFLCWLRERTGTVWACILLHAMKNGLAFSLLFIFDVV